MFNHHVFFSADLPDQPKKKNIINLAGHDRTRSRSLTFLRSRDPGAGGTAKKDNLITDPRADGHNGRRD